MIKPQTVTVTDVDGSPHEYVISRLPATAGLLMITMLPSMTLAGSGTANRETITADLRDLLMRHTGKEVVEGNVVMLTTPALIDNHVPDGEALLRLCVEVIRYNSSFFGQGTVSGFLDFAVRKAEDLLPGITATCTRWLEKLSAQSSPQSQS